MRVGVLTGGGDCPGLNAVIRAVVRQGVKTHGFEFVGFRDGWKGPLEGLTMELGIKQCRGILPRGGTILGSSRTNPFKIDDGVERIKDNLAAAGVDALVAIGGEDTLGVATKLADLGVNVVGVPKTIDNDLSGTDFTFGFDTAVNIATEAIDRLHTTAESHHRVLVVEVMGRHAGWIALHAGIAGGANEVLIPEQPFDIEAVCDRVETRFETQYAPIIVVSEGAVPAEGGDMTLVSGEMDAFGHVRLGGIGDRLAHEIEQRTGKEARAVVLGHIQRGGTPDGVRPLAGHPVRPRTPSTRSPTATSGTWSRCAAPTSSGSRSARARPSSSWSAPRSTPRRRSSSAESADLDPSVRAGRQRPGFRGLMGQPSQLGAGGSHDRADRRAGRQRTDARPQAGDGAQAPAAVRRRRHPRRRCLRRHRLRWPASSAASSGCRSWSPSSSRR